MDVLGGYKIDLKNMRTDTEKFQFRLDDTFFDAVEGTLFRKGNVDVSLRVSKMTGAFELSFRIKGNVTVPCDRCLDDMEQEIDAESVLKVKLGDSYADEGDLVVVPFEDGTLNVAWHIYEFIALEIPMKHVHEPGKCNVAMMEALQGHSAVISGEDEDDGEEDAGREDKPIDPRWNELKKILDNN